MPRFCASKGERVTGSPSRTDWLASRLGKRGEHDVPDRSALDPHQMKPLLPDLFLAEAEHEPFRVRYRLVGTRAVEVTGFDITGRYLDELMSAEPDQPWMTHYKAVYLSHRPLLGATTVPTNLGEMFTYEFGIFPLRNGSESIERFLSIEDYFGLASKLVQVEPWKPLPIKPCS
jgi:hypothetical protein